MKQENKAEERERIYDQLGSGLDRSGGHNPCANGDDLVAGHVFVQVTVLINPDNS